MILSDLGPDIACFTEHWLQNNDIEKVYLKDYILNSYFSRSVFRGGGTAIFSSNLKLSDTQCLVEPVEKDCEFCLSEFTVNNKKILTLCTYRSPSGDVNVFLSKLDEMLFGVSSANRFILVCGDFNVDFTSDNDNAYSLLQLFESYGLSPLVEGVTRVTPHSATQIDNIFSNIGNDGVECRIYKSHISDHFGQILKIRFSNELQKPKVLKKRFFTHQNITRFRYYLQNESWQDVIDTIGVNEKYKCFFRILYYYFDRAFPLENSRIKSSNNWVNQEIKNYSNYIKDLYVWYKMTNSDQIYSFYKAERKQYRKFIADYRKSFNDNNIMNSSNKSKTAWGIFKRLSNKTKSKKDIKLKDKDEIVNDPRTVAELFARQFNPAFRHHSMDGASDQSNFPTIFLYPVDEPEVFQLIRDLPNKYSAGLDEIPVKVLKDIADLVSRPFTNIINECFSTGIFPSDLKVAKITPIFKKGDSSLVSNYRPVSLLSSLSKIFEKALYNRLLHFISANNILVEHQFGFVPKKSTELAIFTTLNNIFYNVDQNKNVAGLYFDLSKAFDTIDHKLLISKLKYYGIRGVCLELLTSYLEDRQQVVCVYGDGGPYFSGVQNVQRGVPQGSILGPLLFLLYVNELSREFHGKAVCQYADDTSVVLTGDDLSNLSGVCSQTIEEMQTWCQGNCLKLNADKTGLLVFSKVREFQSLYVRGLGSKSVPKSESVKFLGVHLDSQLNWNKHCKVLASKLVSYCYLIRRIRDSLSIESVRIFYLASIQSILSYGILFWGSSCRAMDIFKAQKRLIRSIFGLHPRTSCRAYLTSFNVLTAPSLYFLSLVMFIKKNPHLFVRNCDNYSAQMSVVTRGRFDLSIPSHNSTFFEKGPLYRAVKAFYLLPNHIRNIESVLLFRRETIDYLKSKCYYSFDFSE